MRAAGAAALMQGTAARWLQLVILSILLAALFERLGLPATARASLALYNTREDIDALVMALRKVRELFG